MLAGVACATLAAAALAGVGPQVARLARFSLPLALLIAIVNAIVVRDGLTVLVRFGEIPPFGQVDVTLEALAYGAAARRCASSWSCCRSRSSRRRSTPTSCCAACGASRSARR